MLDKKAYTQTFFIAMACIYLCAIFIQYHLFLNWDVGSLLVTTQQLLEGKNYVSDFFIPNPPMSLYIYIPPILLSKITHISIPTMTVAYIFILASFSLRICAKLISDWDTLYGNFFPTRMLLILAGTFLILPLTELGQRDHLLFIFSMPYILSLTNRLDSKPLPFSLASIIGCLLMICIAMKPQFICLAFLLESYYAYRKKSLFAWRRPEILIALILFTCYITSIFIFHLGFITVITPYVTKIYYSAVGQPWRDLIFYAELIFSAIPILMYFLLSNPSDKNLDNVFFISLISFIISFISQRTTFPHHIIPALSFSILFTSLFLYRLSDSHQSEKKKIEIFLLFLFSGWITLITIYLKLPTLNTIFTPKINLVILVSMLSLLSLFIYTYTKKHRWPLMALIIISMYSPLIFMYYNYSIRLIYKNYFLTNLIKYSQQLAPHQSLFFISTATYISSPFIFYTQSPLIQRYDCLWMVPLLIKSVNIDNQEQSVRTYMRTNRDPNFYIHQIANDIQRYKPDLIFIDMKERYGIAANRPFLLMDYFLENPEFKEAWSHYQYLDKIESTKPLFITLNVYKRIDNTSGRGI